MKNLRMRLMISFLVIVTLLLGSFPGNMVIAKATTFHYVALGDSLTVGLEPQQLWDPTALVFGFVDRVYEQALFNGRSTVTNYGINGLTSTGLKNLLVTMDQSKEASRVDIQETLRDPRIDKILKETEQMKKDIINADLLTITIGGNDFGARTYIDIRDLDDYELQSFLDERLDVYQANMKETLDIIYKLNPNVTVVVADQYNPFPRVNQDMYKKLTLLSTQFTTALKRLSDQYQKAGFELILAPVAQSFINREISFTHILRADIHPNQKGYDAMAKVISELLWGVYHPSPAADKEIAIIVKGKELVTPYQPVIFNGTTYVPIREYAESLGAKVTWQGATQQAAVALNGEVVSFTVGSKIITVGDKMITLKDQVQFIHGKVYVPLRAIAEGLKFDVTYSSATKRAFIN